MGATSTMMAGRRMAETLMIDTITVTRLDSTDHDPLTGLGTTVTVYTGKAKVKSFRPYEQSAEAPAATVITQRYDVHVPATAGPFMVGDVVTVTDSPNQPLLVGDVFRVAALHETTFQTAQRLLVDDMVVPSGGA